MCTRSTDQAEFSWDTWRVGRRVSLVCGACFLRARVPSERLSEHKMSDLAEPPTIPMVILDLPQELVMHMLLRAPPSAIAAFVCCSSAAAALGRDNKLWRVLLARVFPDVRPVEALQDSPMVDFISLACGVGLSRDRLKFCRRHCPCGDRGCSGDLLLADGSRCPCVCVRKRARGPCVCARACVRAQARASHNCVAMLQSLNEKA
jgi:hypothetical protein